MRLKLLLAPLLLIGLAGATSAETGAVAAAAVKVKLSSREAPIILTETNSVNLRAEFNETTIPRLIMKLKKLDALQTNDPIYLVLSSPGGSIVAGNELITNINTMRRPVSTIVIFAASMGFMTTELVHGERILLDGPGQGVLMAHRAKGGFQGEFPGQVDTRLAFWEQLVADMNLTVAKRAGVSLKAFEKLEANEYWCQGEHCIADGFADKIAPVQCSPTLSAVGSDTENVVVDTGFIMGHKLELALVMDRCPLNTSPLSITILVDGAPLSADTNKKLVEDSEFMRGVTSISSKAEFYSDKMHYSLTH